jgi:tRNA dimethylallyltransferase
MPQLITILGPTATGKTAIAAHLAKELGGEVICADSRQVYRGLDIGSGKDLEEYTVEGQFIPHHLIDIHDIGYEYNVFKFQEDFHKCFNDILDRNKVPILCGGTGLYIQAVLDGYKLHPVPVDPELRAKLESREHVDLIEELKSKSRLHNSTDTSTKKRTIRALEIARYYESNDLVREVYPPIDNIVFGISLDRAIVKQRITHRLKERLEMGMIEEVEGLLNQGISEEQLKFYGLEYKFLTQYLGGGINYNDMFQRLNSAIHQFAKRQMTWFRRMEKQGHKIHWIDGNLKMDEKIQFILTSLQ